MNTNLHPKLLPIVGLTVLATIGVVSYPISNSKNMIALMESLFAESEMNVGSPSQDKSKLARQLLSSLALQIDYYQDQLLLR